MKTNQKKDQHLVLAPVIILGAVWGLSEAGLGMGLRSCAAFVSGAVMTGVALFFISAVWNFSKRFSPVLMIVVIAALFKVLDAFLLSIPLKHGAIGNPMFAFVMEGAAFLLIISFFRSRMQNKVWGQAAIGGSAALLAANLFPLVKFATGVPACTAAGTGYPLSLYYVHVAVLVSFVTVPLGFFVGAKLRAMETRWTLMPSARKFSYVLTPAAVVLCMAVITLIRMI